ncbi:MAG: putative nitroreductase family protein [Streblomastix strix]|uniref:Putative nitroreductase family protein n=1 Tax=Streblomastix strix TaxID=222440 RepID=A0A5J4U9R5_9EUKA|nr:MAG: putative nitroreductase family protein [Streblomastix strix]
MFRQLLEERQSTREYEDKPVEREKLVYIVQSALKAPTGGNRQLTHYHILTNKEKINQISQVTVQNAPKTINFKEIAERFKFKYNENDPIFFSAPAVIIMTQPADSAINGGIQSLALMLAAQEVGLRTCPLGFPGLAWEDAIKKIINVPENHVFGLAFSVGYSNQKPEPRVKDLNKFEFYE